MIKHSAAFIQAALFYKTFRDTLFPFRIGQMKRRGSEMDAEHRRIVCIGSLQALILCDNKRKDGT